jgi:hypothetical protein
MSIPTLPTSDPYIAYSLGFLWGDGFLTKRRDYDAYQVGYELAERDYVVVKPVLMRWYPWRELRRERMGRVYCRGYVTGIVARELYHLLDGLGYRDKAGSHAKVLEMIDPSCRMAFVLGLFDADGHIHHSNGRMSNANICSHHDQDWTAIQSLLAEQGVNMRVVRRRNEKRNTGHSYLMTTSVPEVFHLSECLYKTVPEGLGLPRKREGLERVHRYVLSHYGSLRYYDHVDYSAFTFPGFTVLEPVSTEGVRWKWRCRRADGTEVIRRASWLAIALDTIRSPV